MPLWLYPLPLFCFFAARPALVEAITKELYTTNAVCKQRYCVNPVVPGLRILAELQSKRWMKQDIAEITPFLDFCGGIVTYDPALPMPNLTDSTRYAKDDTEEAAIEQDRAANELFFYHLSGMGIEAWDHTVPTEESTHPLRPCARAVARMACFTHFPQAYSTSLKGQEVSYLKPCASTCNEYVEACGVECCDDSIKCAESPERREERDLQMRSIATPSPTVPLSSSHSIMDLAASEMSANVVASMDLRWYVDATAPSLMCTGTAPAAQTQSLLQQSHAGRGAEHGAPAVLILVALAMLATSPVF